MNRRTKETQSVVIIYSLSLIPHVCLSHYFTHSPPLTVTDYYTLQTLRHLSKRITASVRSWSRALIDRRAVASLTQCFSSCLASQSVSQWIAEWYRVGYTRSVSVQHPSVSVWDVVRNGRLGGFPLVR